QAMTQAREGARFKWGAQELIEHEEGKGVDGGLRHFVGIGEEGADELACAIPGVQAGAKGQQEIDRDAVATTWREPQTFSRPSLSARVPRASTSTSDPAQDLRAAKTASSVCWDCPRMMRSRSNLLMRS